MGHKSKTEAALRELADAVDEIRRILSEIELELIPPARGCRASPRRAANQAAAPLGPAVGRRRPVLSPSPKRGRSTE